MRGARLAFVATVGALAGLLALSEVHAARDRAAPDETEVARDVEPARAALAAALGAVETSCAEAAASALTRTADVADANALFAALARIRLPEGAGLFLEDVNGRVLAWSGATIDDAAFAAMPRTSDGTWLFSTQASRRLAVRRTRSSPLVLEGVPFLAVCHRPLAEQFPLRNRALTPSSIEESATRGFRVAEGVRVLPPDAAEGVSVKSAFGGTLARLDVRPLSARSWDETVDAAAERRRTGIVAAMAVVVAAGVLHASTRTRPAWLRCVAGAAAVLLVRAALGVLPLSSAADLGPLTRADRYSHALPLDLAGSPLSLALTCGALLVAADLVARAARCRDAAGGRTWPAFALAAVAALASRFGLELLVHDAVENSRVEFFSAETVLPGPASAALLASILAAGIAALRLVSAAFSIARPARPLPALQALAASALLAAALVPLGPDSPHRVALAAAAIASVTAAIAAELLGAAFAVRLAALPLGVAVGLFAPLEAELHRSTRAAVERAAADHVSRTVSAERLFVADTLDGAAADPELSAALAAGRLPRDLALTLWAKSPLARRSGGSSLEIVPLAADAETRTFRADLPPEKWLPKASLDPPPGEISREPLRGEGPGRDGRWIVGIRDVILAGRPAARLRVVLETRPPSPALPELQVLGSSRPEDTRGAPPLSATRYSLDGRLIETDDPYRPAGAPLDPELLRAAAAGRELWRASPQSDRDLEVFVRPYVEDDRVTFVDAFSFDTGGAWTLLLRGTRAALCGALVALAGLVVTLPAWAGNVRLRLAQRLVVSYVLVAALPLLFLGWANRAITLRRVEESTTRELNTAISLLSSALHDDPRLGPVRDLPPKPAELIDLPLLAYTIGHHANLFQGAQLVATSDQGLFDTELLPTRLPGDVYRNVILLGQPFHHTAATVGGYGFDVGYAPWRSATDDKVIGAVSVPLLHQQAHRDRELASAMTAVLGLYLASLVAAIAVGTWLAGRLTKPLSDLTDAARRVARGDLERPVPGAGPDELGEVVAAFNQMQRDLGESRAKLVKAEKEAAWRDMARQVAHEVKNPLTPMRLAAEHLRRAWRDKVPHFDEVLERGVDLIVRQTESLQRIATAFGDFARFPNRKREPVDVAALLDEVLDLWRDLPDLSIVRRVERPLPPVSADPDELRRVLVNLAKNAVEALEGRTGTLTASLARDGAALVLEIADDGPGIPDDIQPRLFEPYLSTKTKGTGLGLAIVKRAVDDLGGTIEVRSPPGAGTTVTVRLPLAE